MSSAASSILKDEGRLAELGYVQLLHRDWTFWHNFGAAFSIISVITPITTLFTYGLNTGGPGVMTVGWLVVGFFTMFVATSMAEILSAVPVSGGPYFWAYMLAPQRWAPFFSWTTGWFNFLGQVAITAGADFGLANLISLTASVTNNYNPSPGKTLGMVAAILVSHVAVNALGIRYLRYFIYVAIGLNSVAVSALAIAVVAGAKTRHGGEFVFGKFFDGTAANDHSIGWGMRASPAYVAVCGLMFSQYTLLGFDASAHLVEETKRAVLVAPRCMLFAVGASFVFGFVLLLCLLFSIQNFELVRTSKLPVLKILMDSCGHGGGLFLIFIVMLCVWHCGLFSMTSNSRMMFSFARDGAIPHRLHIIDRRFQVPFRTVVFAAVCAFLLCLPSLGSTTAFYGTTSIATTGLYISYGIPIFLGMIWRSNFKRGAFNLGRASIPIAVVACLWIGFITVAFCLPTINPVTSKTLNYTGVAVGIVAFGSIGSWVFWARNWFTGRCRNHCPACIRQLDFLAEQEADSPTTTESTSQLYPLQHVDSSKKETSSPESKRSRKIAVKQNIEVEVAEGSYHRESDSYPDDQFFRKYQV